MQARKAMKGGLPASGTSHYVRKTHVSTICVQHTICATCVCHMMSAKLDWVTHEAKLSVQTFAQITHATPNVLHM